MISGGGQTVKVWAEHVPDEGGGEVASSKQDVDSGDSEGEGEGDGGSSEEEEAEKVRKRRKKRKKGKGPKASSAFDFAGLD